MLIETGLHLAIFVAAAFLCALEPGPNFLHLSLQSLRGGRAPAVAAALGMHAGAYPYIVASAVGMAGLLATMPSLLTVLKWMAGAYLLWLGIRTLVERPPAGAVTHDTQKTSTATARSFRTGFLLVAGNPRTPLFYAAFPLLFVSTNGPIVAEAQILAYGLAANAMFLGVDLVFVRMLDHSVIRDRLPVTGGLFRWIGGGLLVGFGLRQLLARN